MTWDPCTTLSEAFALPRVPADLPNQSFVAPDRAFLSQACRPRASFLFICYPPRSLTNNRIPGTLRLLRMQLSSGLHLHCTPTSNARQHKLSAVCARNAFSRVSFLGVSPRGRSACRFA
eukprot:3540287-Rhodomonas_salina.3